MKEEIERAVRGAERGRLPEIAKAMWAAWAAGQVSDEEAQALAVLIETRKAVTVTAKPRHVGSRPRSPAHVERRRRWSASGWLPPEVQCRFTLAEAAALAVVAVEVMERGKCELPIAAIAGKAGVCMTIVKRAIREARTLGLIAVVERRVSYSRNLPNTVTITSSSWSTWLRFRARKLAQGGGGTFVPTFHHHSHSLHGERPRAAPSRGRSMGAATQDVSGSSRAVRR